MHYETILLEKSDHIVTITLNRPEAMNSVNSQLTDELGHAMEQFATDSNLWVAIITGAGSRAFCAGADLKELSQGKRSTSEARQKWGFAGFVRHYCNKPVIAAVNGPALGGGTEIVLACDMVIAADTSYLALPEVKRGVMASAGGLIRLPRQVPLKVAMYHVMTGEPISATQALEWGLVNQVVSSDRLQAAAMALAEKICANSPSAVRLSKEVIMRSLDMPLDFPPNAWDLSDAYAQRIRETEDYKEGPRAFIEKRAPQWRGV